MRICRICRICRYDIYIYIYHFIYHVMSINDMSRDVFHDLPGPKAFRPLDWITSQVRWSKKGMTTLRGKPLRETMWNVTFGYFWGIPVYQINHPNLIKPEMSLLDTFGVYQINHPNLIKPEFFWGYMECYHVLPKALGILWSTSQAGGGDPCSSNLAEFRHVIRWCQVWNIQPWFAQKNIERYW